MESEVDVDSSAIFLQSSRFWIQRVFVPILVLIGTGGNVVTILILTRCTESVMPSALNTIENITDNDNVINKTVRRRRMRCTTNIYLTALAVADLIYLLFVLLLSFEHYPNINQRKYELYWRFYGITHWICDAASSTSVWLTVSFTVERYIIVCHPIKGKVYCTEGRAKNIITVISLLCLFSTASTTFEHQLALKEHCVEKCLESNLEKQIDLPVYNSTVDEIKIDKTRKLKTNSECDKSTNLTSLKDEENKAICVEINDTNCIRNETCCLKSYTISTEATELGKNETYTTIFYWFSSIVFGLLPLVLIATFNCFLVKAVYKSMRMRKFMTYSSESTKQRNENRITVLLIGIVILFLLCQTPTASFLIYDALDGHSDERTRNIKKSLGNIFNFLLTLNASCNFLMYCVLSDNYRRTFKTVFCARKITRNDTMAMSRSQSSYYHRNGGAFRRTNSEYTTPRNLETQSLNSIPRKKSLMMRPIGKARTSDLTA